MRAGGGKLFQNAISAFFSPVKRREVREFYIKTGGKFARSCRSPLQPAELRQKKRAAAHKTITIPEDLDYTGVFDDIFEAYTRSHDLVCVKTTNMGSMFRLTYHIVLRDVAREKEMIDHLRCRNGNLEIAVSRQETAIAEL